MSTRRARIKAVAALPPRRKNAEADKNKQLKELLDKGAKSPRTPQSTPKSADNSPSPSVRNPPDLIPIHALKSGLSSEKTRSPLPQAVQQSEAKDSACSPVAEKAETAEKVSVITSAPSLKNVFASPPPKTAERRRAASPRIFSPKIRSTNITEKLSDIRDTITAQKDRENSIQNDSTTVKEVVKQSHQKEKGRVVPDDYSVPSVPESVTEEMDIMPLQPVSNPPPPIDILMNEIISDNAEVQFDPIVPLPSPSKVRPKLRPAPRLAMHRRNSIQGSASESEDESRRSLLSSAPPPAPPPPRLRHDSLTSLSTVASAPLREESRVRNDSISSTVSQVPTQPPPATSPTKEKQSVKVRRAEMGKRMWRRRRDTTTKPEVLTMYDLIFFNPTTNPIVPNQDEVNAKEANAKEAEKSSQQEEDEEDADDPPAGEGGPVPQIKLGPNGEIVLDEKSLVIQQSDAKRKVSSVVREGAWGTGKGRYTRAARTADWSAAETVRFYRALAAIGTDFSLMAPLFPGRNRRDLKLKFKKEERINGGQVDKALRSATTWDLTRLQEEFKEERIEEKRKAEEEQRRLQEARKAERERAKMNKEMGYRQSRSAKAMEMKRNYHPVDETMTANYFLRRALEERKRTQRHKAPTPNPPQATPTVPQAPQYATVTRLTKIAPKPPKLPKRSDNMATITKVDNPKDINDLSGAPTNIESGSLVVLRVNDPNNPGTTMMQTYIAHKTGKLTPVELPPTFLNSVLGYMKSGTPSTASAASSPQLTSPSSSRSVTPGVIQMNPSPVKRQQAVATASVPPP